MARVTYIERLFLEPGEFSSERTRRRARRLAKRCPHQTELKNTIRNAPDGALHVRGMGGNRLEVLTVVKKTGGGTSLTRHGYTAFGSPAHKLAFLRGARSGDRLLNKEIREHFSKLTEEHDQMFDSFYSSQAGRNGHTDEEISAWVDREGKIDLDRLTKADIKKAAKVIRTKRLLLNARAYSLKNDQTEPN